MIERHVTFHLKDGKAHEFTEFFLEAYRPAMARTNGFIEAHLLQAEEDPSSIIMVLRFNDLESAREWRESERHAELKPRLKSMYTESDLKVYNVLG